MCQIKNVALRAAPIGFCYNVKNFLFCHTSTILSNMTITVQENVQLAQYSVFKIGGPARFFVVAKTKDALIEALHFAKEKTMPFFMLGAGSNILVADKGFGGIVIKNELNTIAANEDTGIIRADAGISMPRLVVEAAKHSIAGFEWGIGIPGSIGGSVRGNAGAFGKEIKDVLVSASVYDIETGKEKTLTNENCAFGYRDSIFKHHPNLIILSATFQGEKGEQSAIQNRIKEISGVRSKTQDIGAKCAGCIFKNPKWPNEPENRARLLKEFPELTQFQDRETIPASYLIDHAGLKGKRIGNAEVSFAHANYITNEGGATADEVIQLIAFIKEYVHRMYGVMLEEEIQYVGFDKK
ncbi:MAG: UDP-N-acetylmuramate dehydrogenase [bacterium]|nr:UDP-N-acetylmuramate dehydrogenase [bacterium]